MFRMSLYAHPHVRRSGSYFGYAYTYYEIEKSFRQYRHNQSVLQVDLNSPKSKIQMYYGSPPGYFFPHQYKIQMTQWESTLCPPHWSDVAKDYDEWWTANKFGADAFINSGIPKEKIHIYEHGVDSSIWTPKLRGNKDKIRFLHIDSGSPRKRSDIAIKAFKQAFGNNKNYELTLKHSHIPSSGVDWSNYENLKNYGIWENTNIRHIRENMGLNDLVSLYHFHDILIYPSEGEGFGLIPLQALATGMPTISTGIWCSYEKHLHNNIIESKLGQSEVVETYKRFGDVVLPNVDSTSYLMKTVAENIKNQSLIFFNNYKNIIEEYNWQRLTNNVLDGLIERTGIDMFGSYKGYLK